MPSKADDFQTAVEREFMEGTRDPFDYYLAEALHMTVEQMRTTISNREYLEWRAFYVYRNAMAEFETEKARRG